MRAIDRWLRRAVPATPAERAAVLWSFGYFFMLLASYYVLRPLRDRMGIAGGVKALPWLFTATFVTLLVAQPLYGALVAKLPRGRFVPIVYQVFASSRWRCSGRSWPTSSAASKASGCSASSARAARPAGCSGR
jgi:AAA family ATP:ADP antiporter